MNRDGCTREADVAKATAGQAWSDELRSHVQGCAACQDVELVTTSLMAAVQEESLEPLPDAGRLWWRSQIEARQEARRRSMRPLDAAERAEPFVAVAVALVVMLFSGDHVIAALARLLPGDATTAAVQLALPAPVLAALLGGVVLTTVMLLVGLGAAFASDR